MAPPTDPTRYGFLETVLAKRGGALPPDAGRLARWQQAYHDLRGRVNIGFVNQGEVPGFRAMALQGTSGNVSMIGVREDGWILTGTVARVSDRDREIVDPPEGWVEPRLDDPEAVVRLARAFGARALGQTTPEDDGDLGPWRHALYGGSFRAMPFNAEASDMLGLSVHNPNVDQFRQTLAGRLAHEVYMKGEGLGVYGLAQRPAPRDGEEGGPSLDPTKAPGPVHHLLRAAILAQERRHAKLLSAVVGRACDPEALRRVRATRLPGLKGYAFLMGARPARYEDLGESGLMSGGSPLVPDPLLAERRRQAVDLHPWASPALLENTRFFGARDGLRDMVDEGRPFEATLAKMHKLPEAHLRRLRGGTWQKMGADVMHNPHAHLPLWASLAPEHLPSDRPGFRALRAARDAAIGYEEVFGMAAEDGLSWQEGFNDRVTHRLATLGGRFDRALLWRDAQDVLGAKDVLADLHRKVLVPMVFQALCAKGMDEGAALDRVMHIAPPALDFHGDGRGTNKAMPWIPLLMGRDPGLRRTAEAVGAWHRAAPAIAEKLRDPVVAPDHVWTPYTGADGVDMGKGWSCHEVCSSAGMAVIGAVDGHCVAGYATQAAQGRSIIMEVRHHGVRRSTLELGVDNEEGDPSQWRLVQNRAMFNAAPEEGALRAGDRLLAQLRKTSPAAWAAHRAVLAQEEQAWRARAKTPLDVLAQTISFDPRDKARTDQAFDLLKPFMDKRTAAMGAEGFREQVVAPMIAHASVDTKAKKRMEEQWF